MEKLKAHYSLIQIKELMRVGRWKITLTAQRNAWEQFDLDVDGIKAVVLELNSRVFYKSMTTIHDSTIWQDVYHPIIGGKKGYLKVQIAEGNTVVIQLKKK